MKGGKALPGVLLHESGLVDSTRESLESERALDQVGQHLLGCGQVVGHHLSLGNPVLGKEDLLGVGNFDQSVILPPHGARPWSDTIDASK